MKRTKIKELEDRIEKLEKDKVYPPLEHPWATEQSDLKLDPECLHNGCGHDKNPFCLLSCPHCSSTVC